MGQSPVPEAIVEQSMAITKASYDPTTRTMRFRLVGSDTKPDLASDSMSLELFYDFMSRIENKAEVPVQFKSFLHEKSGWDGGMPYVSISHIKSGVAGRNIPADTEKVYVDGNCLKATAVCRDTELGRAVFQALKSDIDGTSPYKEKIRVSIGFIDLAHSHGDYVFERTTLEKRCPMCENKVGNKVYLKGQLVHFALTRKPMNPRTNTEVLMAKSDTDITTREEDAESIVGKALAQELEVNKTELPEAGNSDLIVEKADPSKEDECTGKDGCTCKACAAKEEEKSAAVPAKEPEMQVAKSSFDIAIDKLRAHILELKSLPAEQALPELQSDFELVAKSVQDEFTAQKSDAVTSTEMADMYKAVVAMKTSIENLLTRVEGISTEITILKSQAATVGKKTASEDVPAPRGIQVERSTIPTAQSSMQKPMSIKELAARSVH